MAVSEAQKRATAKYEKENYDKVLVRFSKGTKKRIERQSESVNAYIIQAVIERLEADEDEDLQEQIQTNQNAENKQKTTKEDNSIKEPEKSEIKGDATLHWDEKTEEADSSENNPVKAGFDGLKACEWNVEEHSGFVPHPPVGTPKNAIWDPCTGGWYEPLPF